MNKINFENGKPPYLNAENLNLMQDNMEGAGVPAGGFKSQILSKKSDEDNDVEWIDNTGGVTGDTLPIGTIVDYDGDTPPTNWEEITEAEWKNAQLSTGVSPSTRGGSSVPQYKKVGNTVYIRGAVQTAWESGTKTLFNLPVGFRPANNVINVCATTGYRIARVYIANNGNVNLEWIINISDASEYRSEAWIDIHTQFEL